MHETHAARAMGVTSTFYKMTGGGQHNSQVEARTRLMVITSATVGHTTPPWVDIGHGA